MLSILAATMIVIAVPHEDLVAAANDRAQFPKDRWGYVYYLSTSHLSGESRSKCEAALAFSTASASQQPTIELCTPSEVRDGLWRIELDQLRWDWRLWHKVIAKHPYSQPGTLPLVVRADWLVVQLSDATESDAHMLLLYGREKITRDEYLRTWGVNNRVESHFGVIAKKAANSPNVAQLRWIENRPTNERGSAWGTRDSDKITLESDPLQHLDGGFEHQAEEWLTTIPKRSTKTGESGVLLVSFLANAKGEQQKEAPPSIVTDHHGFRGQAAIRFPGGCVSCHAGGINPPASNELREYIFAGVDIYATPKAQQEAIERFHLTKSGKQIARDNEDIALAIKAINGLDGQANAEAYNGTIDLYDAPVTLERAAAELHTEPKTLTLALAYCNNAGNQIGVRLSGLPHGKPVPRATWEQTFVTAKAALDQWKAKQ